MDSFGHAMYGNLSFTEGVPDQANFNKYRIIRMQEIPKWTFISSTTASSPLALANLPCRPRVAR